MHLDTALGYSEVKSGDSERAGPNAQGDTRSETKLARADQPPQRTARREHPAVRTGAEPTDTARVREDAIRCV